jgi:hypothetical protein
MGIDLRSEQIIDVRREAPAYLGRGRNGRPPHISFLVRAIKHGINGHKLEALRVGSRWLTSVEALQRWAERQTPGTASAAGGPTPSPRRQEVAERADRELDRLGL